MEVCRSNLRASISHVNELHIAEVQDAGDDASDGGPLLRKVQTIDAVNHFLKRFHLVQKLARGRFNLNKVVELQAKAGGTLRKT